MTLIEVDCSSNRISFLYHSYENDGLTYFVLVSFLFTLLYSCVVCRYVSMRRSIKLVKKQVCDKSTEYFSNKPEIIGRHIQRENNIDLRRVLVVLIKTKSEKSNSTYVANHEQAV